MSPPTHPLFFCSSLDDSKARLSSLLVSAEVRGDDGNTTLIEAVVLASHVCGLKVQGEEQLSTGGVQVDWQCHLALGGVVPSQPEV